MFNLNLIAQNINMDTILNDLNPEKFNGDFSEYDKNTAIYCAQLSEIAYWDSTKISKIINRLELKYTNKNHKFKFIEDEKSGTQLLLFGTNKYVIIAFRGTEFTKELKDIILDVKLFRYYQDSGYSNLPAGHGGFRRGIMNLIDNNDIFNELRNFQKICNINDDDNFPIYTTGHSLGAALATLIIEPLNFEKFNFSGCYNFAPPLVISKTDSENLTNKYGAKIYDIVNFLDYIPRAGKSSRKYLGRVGKFYRICETGEINNENEKRNGKYVGHRWRTKFKLYKFHKLSGYLDGLKYTGNTNKEIVERKNNNVRCF
jgi:Lipase (class 3)